MKVSYFGLPFFLKLNFIGGLVVGTSVGESDCSSRNELTNDDLVSCSGSGFIDDSLIVDVGCDEAFCNELFVMIWYRSIQNSRKDEQFSIAQ